ncbi:hypothetical protein ABZ615_10890 [Streptomyces sp. NPDC007325]|uniref:hypothetical protein n=1 Tax=Streptomyces sp. NPDC007325 TaxID=3154588 RepID=UPI0033CB4EB1
MRRTVGAVAAALGGTTLGAALVLLAGFVYQLVAGNAAGGLAGWAFGLLLLALILFGVFGSLLPDEEAAAALSDTPGRKPTPEPHTTSEPTSPPGPAPATASGAATVSGAATATDALTASDAATVSGAATASDAPTPPGAATAVADGKTADGAAVGADDGWSDALVFFLVLFGLIAGGPFGIAGYEALRPEHRPPAVTSPSLR